MKYLIASLIKGDAEKYHRSLFERLDELFKLKVPLSHKPPSHITLKNSFETNNIRIVENLLRDISKKTKPMDVSLTDFNYFNKKEILFIEINASKEFEEMQKEIINIIKTKTLVNILDTDIKQKFHLTLAFPKIFQNTKAVWNYLTRLNKPSLKTKIDNISILKKEEGVWKIHKEFPLL